MEQHQHGNVFRERDVNRIISQYGRKPSEDLKSRMMKSLEAERGKFRRVEEYRSQERKRSRGR